MMGGGVGLAYLVGNNKAASAAPPPPPPAAEFKYPDLGSGYNPRNERIYDTLHKSFLPARPEQFLKGELMKENKKIVVIGEVHSNPCHHHAEFEILKTLHISYKDNGSNNNNHNQQAPARDDSSSSYDSSGDKSGVAVGLECFYRQHQRALDRFIFKHQDIATLKAETAWNTNWGFDLNYYAKIFKYAAANKIRLVGLNVPAGVASLVGARGYDNIPKELKDLLPALDLSNRAHRDQFVRAMGGHAHSTSSSSSSTGTSGISAARMQHLYEAQTLWEEYMSESAANYLKRYPNHKLLVIAGLGHVLGRYGIPDRIEKRVGFRPFVIVPQVVQWSDQTGLPNVNVPLTQDKCDWAWYTEAEIQA
jgi:uncharacterized iron-regulated protein